MELLKTHVELIEAKPEDISVGWKVLQIFLYFVSAVSGYGSGVLFYILWHEIFAGNCPLWAQIVSQMQPRLAPEELAAEDEVTPVSLPDWRRKIIVIFSKYTGHCNLYHLISLSSCIFGIFWMTLFTMCGKGGYDSRIFVAPWTIVPPAIIFQLIFSMIALFVVHDMENGYSKFVNDFEKFSSTINESELITLKQPCRILQSYLEMSEPTGYNICYIHPILQILSWTMAWSWILGLVTLILRIICIRDFSLLTVRIYKLPENGIEKNQHETANSKDSKDI